MTAYHDKWRHCTSCRHTAYFWTTPTTLAAVSYTKVSQNSCSAELTTVSWEHSQLIVIYTVFDLIFHAFFKNSQQVLFLCFHFFNRGQLKWACVLLVVGAVEMTDDDDDEAIHIYCGVRYDNVSSLQIIIADRQRVNGNKLNATLSAVADPGVSSQLGAGESPSWVTICWTLILSVKLKVYSFFSQLYLVICSKC